MMRLTGRPAMRERVPALTVIAHARPTMVPSRKLLVDPIDLSRSTPEFGPLTTGAVGGSLDDPFVSRTPIRLAPDGDGVRIDRAGSSTAVEIDGAVLDDSVVLDSARIERGVVLCLARQVALVLHWVAPAAGPSAGDFGLIGCSAGMARVCKAIRTVADIKVPVLIRGESGTGKELIARAIHDRSLRADTVFEAVNMAALPPTLAASELFGHVKGAFTGAHRDREGCFARAHGGTLFLDEIGDTPAEVQPQLLRVLETSHLRPVGAASEQVIDVRIISATDVALEQAIAGGAFREALLQRLAGYQIHVPPLRERREDIGPLVYHFAHMELDALGSAALIDEPDPHRPWLSASVIARLARHDWPGNVRQLRNVVRQLVISNRDKPELRDGDELERLLQSGTGPAVAAGSERLPAVRAALAPAPRPASESSYRDPASVSEGELVAALRANGYRLAATAKALAVSRTSLYAMVERSARVRKATDLSRDDIDRALSDTGGDIAAAAASLGVSTHALKLRRRAVSEP